MGSIPLPALAIQSPPRNALEEYLRAEQLKQQNAVSQQQAAALQQQTQQREQSFPVAQQQAQANLQQTQIENAAKQQQAEQMKQAAALQPQFVTKDENGKVTGFDNEGYENALTQAGLGQYAIAHQTARADAVSKLASADEKTRQRIQELHKGMYERIEGIKGISDPAERQQYYLAGLDWAKQNGIDVSQWPTQAPSNDQLTHMEGNLGMGEQILADAKTRADIAAKNRGPAPAAAVQEYQFAQSQGYKGTFEQWTKEQAAIHRAPRNDQTTAEAIEAAAQSIAPMNPKDLTRLKDIASLRGDQRLLVYNRAKQINPDFSPSTVDRRVKMLDDYQNGKTSQNLQSFGTFLEHAGEASRITNAFRTTSIPLVNTPLNKIREKFGDAKYSQFIAALEPVRKEFEGFLLGGRALYGDDRKAAETILNDNSSPAQIQSALKQMGHTVKARYNEIAHRFSNGMGGAKMEDVVGSMSDEAMQGAKDIGLNFGSAAPVIMKAPNGMTKEVPADQVEHYKSLGATVVH